MGMFRYKFKSVAASNFFGHGIGASGANTVNCSASPHFDFYQGNTFLFRVTGISFFTGSKGRNTSFNVDTLVAGSAISYSDTAWPANLDRLRTYKVSDGSTFGADVTSATFDRTRQQTSLNYENGGSQARFLSIMGDSTTQTTSTNLDNVDIVAEFSGNFTHVEMAYPWPLWAANTGYSAITANNFTIGGMFIAQETGQQPKIYAPLTNTTGAADFDAFVAANSSEITAAVKTDLLGGQVFAIETDFNNPATNRPEFKATQGASDIIPLYDEPSIYINTAAASDGTGYSRQSPRNVVPTLNDNDEVLVIAGSTVGGTTFTSDALLTAQNGVVGGGGSSTGTPRANIPIPLGTAAATSAAFTLAPSQSRRYYSAPELAFGEFVTTEVLGENGYESLGVLINQNLDSGVLINNSTHTQTYKITKSFTQSETRVEYD